MIIDFRNIGGGGGSGYTLPVATSEILGGVKVGSGLTITSAGTLSADAQPVGIATTATTGVVKIGSGITVDSAGTISVDAGGGLSEVQLPFGSYTENKQLNTNERPFNKGFFFEFNIGDGQWTLNPVLSFYKMYSDVKWNSSAYIDMYLEKKSNDSTPHFYVIVANNVGNGNQTTRIIDEHLPFDFIQQENSVSYNIPSFTFSGMTSQGTEDYTIEGMVATIKDKGDGAYELRFDNSNCSVDNQANTYMNQFFASDDYLNYNDNVYAVAYTFGWDFKANEYNYGVVKVGNGLYIDNGALTVEFPQTRQIERRFLICTEGYDQNGAEAPFVCQDDTPLLDQSSPATEFVFYDTMVYSDLTDLFILAYEEDDGEGNMETFFTATIYGVPEGYTIDWNNYRDDTAGSFDLSVLNAYEIAGGQEQFEDCDFYAAKINNGLVIHFVNVGINNYTLPKDGDDNDIYFTRGSYSDTVYVNGYQCNCIVNDDTMAIEYPNIMWDLVNPNANL